MSQELFNSLKQLINEEISLRELNPLNSFHRDQVDLEWHVNKLDFKSKAQLLKNLEPFLTTLIDDKKLEELNVRYIKEAFNGREHLLGNWWLVLMITYITQQYSFIQEKGLIESSLKKEQLHPQSKSDVVKQDHLKDAKEKNELKFNWDEVNQILVYIYQVANKVDEKWDLLNEFVIIFFDNLESFILRYENHLNIKNKVAYLAKVYSGLLRSIKLMNVNLNWFTKVINWFVTLKMEHFSKELCRLQPIEYNVNDILNIEDYLNYYSICGKVCIKLKDFELAYELYERACLLPKEAFVALEDEIIEFRDKMIKHWLLLMLIVEGKYYEPEIQIIKKKIDNLRGSLMEYLELIEQYSITEFNETLKLIEKHQAKFEKDDCKELIDILKIKMRSEGLKFLPKIYQSLDSSRLETYLKNYDIKLTPQLLTELNYFNIAKLEIHPTYKEPLNINEMKNFKFNIKEPIQKKLYESNFKKESLKRLNENLLLEQDIVGLEFKRLRNWPQFLNQLNTLVDETQLKGHNDKDFNVYGESGLYEELPDYGKF